MGNKKKDKPGVKLTNPLRRDYGRESSDHSEGLHKICMYVWELCCMKHGMGGTPKSINMFDRIMRFIFKEIGL